MPITYVEFVCDLCQDKDSDTSPDMAILRDGRIACKVCGDKIPDQVFKWILPDYMNERSTRPEDDEQPEETPEEPEA